jgi:hypothetical protein
LITGAADDDPSGISTDSVTGAAFDYSRLWTAIFAFPLMAAVQIVGHRVLLLHELRGLGLDGGIGAALAARPGRDLGIDGQLQLLGGAFADATA